MSAVLLVKTSSLGDVVHNLPVVSDVRAPRPELVVDWVVEEAFAPIPGMHPGLREVITVAVRRWRRALAGHATWREMAAFRHVLRGREYQDVIDTQGLLKSALIARMARGRRCGYAADSIREPLAARLYDARFTVPKSLHAVERNRRLAGAALGYVPSGDPDYGIRAQPSDADWLPADRYAVLLTATSREEKLWPDTHWLALAAELHGRGFASVLPAGTASERQRAQRLAQNMRRAVVAPPLSIAALAGVLAGAGVVIGVDTGLTHLAAALRVPVVGLYCGSDPRLTGVLAGGGAINLGTALRPPSPQQALAAADSLLAHRG